MYMVVVLHYWLFATSGRGVEKDEPVTFLNFVFLQIFLIFCHGGVPLFFLLSGYFLSTKEWNFRWVNLFRLWFETLLYGVICCFLFYKTTPSISTDFKSILKSILPLIGNKYWFISVYIALSLFSPFLSKLSQQLERNQFNILLLIIVLFGMTFWFGFPFGNAIGVGNGFTLIYAAFLYMTGAYIRKFDISLRGRKRALLFWGTLWGAFLFSFITETSASGHIYVKFPHYNDLSILVAIVFFIIVKDWKPSDCKLSRCIANCSPYVLGVYLIHENVYVREHLWHFVSETFNPSFSSNLAIPLAIVIPFAVFFLCLIISAFVQWILRISHIQDCFLKTSSFLQEKCDLYLKRTS